MPRTASLVALLVMAACSTGCQQLGRKSNAGPSCGCGSHAMPPACCTSTGGGLPQITTPPPVSAPTPGPHNGTYEGAPNAIPAVPPANRAAPPPPVESARKPMPQIFQ